MKNHLALISTAYFFLLIITASNSFAAEVECRVSSDQTRLLIRSTPVASDTCTVDCEVEDGADTIKVQCNNEGKPGAEIACEHFVGHLQNPKISKATRICSSVEH